MIPVFVGAGFPRPVVTKTSIENHYIPVNCRVGSTIVKSSTFLLTVHHSSGITF